MIFADFGLNIMQAAGISTSTVFQDPTSLKTAIPIFGVPAPAPPPPAPPAPPPVTIPAGPVVQVTPTWDPPATIPVNTDSDPRPPNPLTPSYYDTVYPGYDQMHAQSVAQPWYQSPTVALAGVGLVAVLFLRARHASPVHGYSRRRRRRR